MSLLKENCTLTNEQLIEACDIELDKLVETGGESFTMRIPADHDKDTDLLFAELIKRFKEAKGL